MNSKIRNSLMALVALSALALPFDASAKIEKDGGSRVTFRAVGPAGMNIDGTTNDMAVREEGANVVVAVPLQNLTTGISLRDKHMREKYLEVPKFPEAVLRVPRASLKMPSGGAELSSDAQGTLTLHGQSRPVTFHYSAKDDGGVYRVSGNMNVNMKDYGIEVPSYLGVTVKPDVVVRVQFAAKDK